MGNRLFQITIHRHKLRNSVLLHSTRRHKLRNSVLLHRSVIFLLSLLTDGGGEFGIVLLHEGIHKSIHKSMSDFLNGREQLGASDSNIQMMMMLRNNHEELRKLEQTGASNSKLVRFKSVANRKNRQRIHRSLVSA